MACLLTYVFIISTCIHLNEDMIGRSQKPNNTQACTTEEGKGALLALMINRTLFYSMPCPVLMPAFDMHENRNQQKTKNRQDSFLGVICMILGKEVRGHWLMGLAAS